MSHLPKKVTYEREVPVEREAVPTAQAGPDETTQISCELDEPKWSVVSFDEVEAGGLTYRQACILLSELEADGIPGLCIITDSAGHRALTA